MNTSEKNNKYDDFVKYLKKESVFTEKFEKYLNYEINSNSENQIKLNMALYEFNKIFKELGILLHSNINFTYF